MGEDVSLILINTIDSRSRKGQKSNATTISIYLYIISFFVVVVSIGFHDLHLISYS